MLVRKRVVGLQGKGGGVDMNDRDFEILLKKLLAQDLSAGTEAFRDALLDRCLDVLCEDDGLEVSDDDLELLAAAGDPFAAGSLSATDQPDHIC